MCVSMCGSVKRGERERKSFDIQETARVASESQSREREREVKSGYVCESVYEKFLIVYVMFTYE